MKHLVPLYVANYVGAPGSVQPGYKKFYLKNGHFKLYDGASENDLVLDRPLDNFTNLSGTVTSSDTVLTALEKLQTNISSILSSSYATTSWVGSNFVVNQRTITINGVSYDLSADREWIVSTDDNQDLQSVLDIGNIAIDREIVLNDSSGDNSATYKYVGFYTNDGGNNQQNSIDYKSWYQLKGNGKGWKLDTEVGLEFTFNENNTPTKITNVNSTESITLNVPDKPEGEYTIATTDDINPTLDDVLNNGNTTDKTAIFSDGTKTSTISHVSVFVGDINTDGTTINNNRITFRKWGGGSSSDIVQELKLNTTQSNLYTPGYQLPAKTQDQDYTLVTNDELNLNNVVMNGGNNTINAAIVNSVGEMGQGYSSWSPGSLNISNLGSDYINIIPGAIIFKQVTGNSVRLISPTTSALNVIYRLPLKTAAGTYDLVTSETLGNYVPYTGATGNVDLGDNLLSNTKGFNSIRGNNTFLAGTDFLSSNNTQFIFNSVGDGDIYSDNQSVLIKANLDDGVNINNTNDLQSSNFNFLSDDISFSIVNTSNGLRNDFKLSQYDFIIRTEDTLNQKMSDIIGSVDGFQIRVLNDALTQDNSVSINNNYTNFTRYIETGEGYVGNYLKLSTTAAEPVEAGKIVWNSADGTFDMGLLNDVTLQAGQEMHMYAKASGVIANGDAVQFAGAQGDHLLIKKAVPSEINTNPEYFVGVATQDFTNNQFGYVTVFGQVRGLDTDDYSEGTVLYYQSMGATAGLLTDVRPTGPNAKITVAAVVRSHQNQGAIFVRPQVMPMLGALQDVEIVSATQGDVLQYNGSTQVWENKELNTDNLVPYTGATGDVDLGENSIELTDVRFTDSDSFIRTSNDVRNWYLTGDVYYVGLIEANATGIFFKPDGTRFYIVGQTNDRVIAFDMSIAWDIKTAVQAEFYSVSIEGTPTDLFFKEDGSVLYILGNTTDLVRQYNLPTAWNLTGATASGTFNVTTQDGDPSGIYIREDGLKMYIAGNTTPDKVLEYDLSTAWNITTASFLQSFSVSGQETGISGLDFSDDGTRMYVLGTTGDDITEYRLSTPWDISTSVYFSESFTFIQESAPSGFYYNQEQNLAFVIGAGSDYIIGLGTTKEIKLFGNSVTTDGQLYVGGRMEVRSTIYNYGNITTLGSIAAAGAFSCLSTSLASTTATLSQGTINLNGATTTDALYTSTTNINYGRMYSGQTKRINIARNSQYGSNTFITIGDANSGTMTSTLDTLFKRDVSVLGSLSVKNNVSPVLASSIATGTIEVYDTFTEATNTLLDAHTPDIGSGWSKFLISTFTTATFTVFSATNTMGVTTPITNQGVIYTQDTVLTNPNYEVSVDLIAQATSDDNMWLFARYQNFDNFYGVKWSSTIGNCSLHKKVNGVYTTLSTLQIAPILGATSLTLRVFDNYIVVLNGGVVVMTAYDESIILPGYAAIGAGNILQATSDDFATWRFDNFKVQTYENNYTNSYIENGNFGIGTITPTSKLEVVGNIAATTYNDYIPLPTEAATATGVTISFVTDTVYGTLDTPETGNITASLTGANLGVTSIIIHNSSTEPTFSSEFKKLSGSGGYIVDVINYIYCTYIADTEIIYSINQRT